MYQLDKLDARLLVALDTTPEATVVHLAEVLGVSRNTVQSRLRRWTEHGVLAEPSARIDLRSLGRPLRGFVTLAVQQQSIELTLDAIASIPEVTEMHTITGDGDLLVRVAARDTVDFHRITQLLQASPGVSRSRTVIATTEVIRHRSRPLLDERVRAED